MKLFTTILFLTTCLSLTARPKTELTIGYWVVTYNTTDGYEITKTTDIADVYSIAKTVLPNNCIDFKSRLKTSTYVNIELIGKSFYVGVKKINKKGRYKELNKKEIKEYLLTN